MNVRKLVPYVGLLMLIIGFLIGYSNAQTPVPATPAPLPNLTRGEVDLVKTLAGLKISLATGAAANTNIAVTGITTADSLLSCLQSRLADANDPTHFTDRTSETWISGAGTIKLTTANSTGSQLIVIWYDHNSYTGR